MSDDGHGAMRHYSLRLLTAFIRTIEPRLTAGPVTIDDMATWMAEFLTSASATSLYVEGYQQIHQVTSADLVKARRGDPFQRLLAHPLSDAFEAGDLSRDLLPSYFSFLHLVLGDARTLMGDQCADILADLREEPFFSWDMFYQDPRAQEIYWTTLARIAESFKRFDARRDWFIGLMQNKLHAVSLGANAFLPLTHGHAIEDAHPFGLAQFHQLFHCLFHPLRDLKPGDRQAFIKLFGDSPDQYFATIYRNIGE